MFENSRIVNDEGAGPRDFLTEEWLKPLRNPAVRHRERVLRWVLMTAVVLLLPLALYAETATELQDQISEHNAQIEQLNREIASYEKQLTDIAGKKQTLLNTLASLDISRKQIAARISVTKANINTIELQIRELNGSISDKEQSIERDSAGLAQALHRLNEYESTSLVEQVLNNESVSAIWDDVEANHSFDEAISKHIDSLTHAKQELTVNRDESEKKRKLLIDQRAVLASQQQSLDINRKEQGKLLADTKAQESTYQEQLSAKRTAKIAFEKALTDLESKLKYTLDPASIPSVGKGVLQWPLDKITVTQHFGNTQFAQSGAYSGKGHNGVDFRASIGTPVKAALSGTITGTGNTDVVRGCYSYGQWVLIKHDNGLSTLYAHLSQISVSMGQEVSTGSVLGYSGSTGYATGPHLHFTVYASGAVQVRQLGTNTPCGKATMPVSALNGYLNPMDYL